MSIVSAAFPDPKDERDYVFRDLVAGGTVEVPTEADWKNGYNVYDDVGLLPELRNQVQRMTCVAETCARYARVLNKVVTGDDIVFAASSLYPFIRLPGGGAYLRDGALQTVAGRLAPVSVISDEDASGVELSEAAAGDKTRITKVVEAAGVKFDVFDSAYVVEGGTDKIGVFAAALRTGKGIIMGFTGTNPGWRCPACRAPKFGEATFGHSVFGAGFGLTDVEGCGVPVGSKAIFVQDHYAGQNCYTSGRWKGYRAIPAAYFEAGGSIPGLYVFNAWAIVPKPVVSQDQWAKDFTNRHDLKLARHTGNGAFAFVKGGKLQVIAPERSGEAALTVISRGSRGSVDVTPQEWERLPKASF